MRRSLGHNSAGEPLDNSKNDSEQIWKVNPKQWTLSNVEGGWLEEKQCLQKCYMSHSVIYDYEAKELVTETEELF